MHMCPDQPPDFGHVAAYAGMQFCPADTKTSCWSQRRTQVKWCIRDGALPELHLHYPQFKAHAEPGQCGGTAATQAHKHSQTAVSAEGLASNWSSQVPGKLTRRFTTGEASAHKSAFYILIILQYTRQYLVLLSYLFTEHQELLAAEKPCKHIGYGF